MVDHEKSVLIGYLLNLLANSSNKHAFIRDLYEYLETDATILEQQLDEFSEFLEPFQDDLGSKKNLSRKAAHLIAVEIADVLTGRLKELLTGEPCLLELNLRALALHLALDPLEAGFLGLVVRQKAYGHFSSFFNDLARGQQNIVDLSARCLGAPPEALVQRLKPDGRLLSSGVLVPGTGNSQDLDDAFQVLDQVSSALSRNHGGVETLLSRILGEPCTPSLSWGDFDHLGNLRERLTSFLSKSVNQGMVGVNILFWGAPGTGKTEFCKTLAAQSGMQLYAVGETDEDGAEPNRGERMTAFRLSQNLLRFRKDTLLMFDEMDDLFQRSSLRQMLTGQISLGSKVFMNRLLEHNPVPTVWIVNDVEMLDEAFIRRMSLAIEFKNPPASVRERVWQRVLEKNSVTMESGELRQLTELNIPPAVIDSAARFTRQIGGGAEDFRFASQGIIHAMRGGRPLPRPEMFERFCPELTCTDLDLAALTEQLGRVSSRAFSLCLYGPPGTGKSAYLRHLAEALQIPVLLKRASDLLDMYVGGSEKQIAAAFQEAIDCEALLIFDEADSLLSDRRQAVRRYEISQVNEMLTWMERHPLPFACTTNLMEHLDPASLRRFTFKLGFRFMTREQTAKAFEIFFQQPAPDSLRPLQRLTPGDFAVVRKKAEVLGLSGDPEAIVRFLALEEGEKRLSQKSIGFAP